MYSVNENYLKLPGSYLFSNIAKKVAAFSAANPNAPIIRLGIGDVTQPLAPAIIEALHSAVDEMAVKETFKGYAPRSQRMISRQEDVILLQMRSLSQTEQRVILEISRRSLDLTVESQ